MLAQSMIASFQLATPGALADPSVLRVLSIQMCSESVHSCSGTWLQASISSRMSLLPYLMLGCAKLLQSCLILCDPMDCSPPGSSIHGILQARMLCPSPGDLPDPGIKPLSLKSPALAGGFFITNTTWKVLLNAGNVKISTQGVCV